MAAGDQKRLAKFAAGRPAVLTITEIVGNGSTPVAVAKSSPRSLLVSALAASGGSAYTDFTATASFIAGGSLDPGTNISTDPCTITWYRFDPGQ